MARVRFVGILFAGAMGHLGRTGRPHIGMRASAAVERADLDRPSTGH